MKQAYIERNFAPPKLFRDARELIPENATTATTAYGAIEDVPKDIDIFIGGFVCKDLSTLNSRQKDITANGETGDTWRAMLSYSKKNRPTIVLVENVQGRIAYWDYIVSEWSAAGYEAAWRFCDTKKHYLPQTRLRMYMIAVNRNKFGKHAAQAVGDWKDSMESLERPCSTPFGAFLKGTATEFGESCAVPPSKSEVAWVQCKLKYDRIRSEERLGTKRPVTRWSENGTLRPPDHGNIEWYGARSSREWECIDIAHLQRVHRSYDTRFKMEVWDVSQSIDYYGAPFGIVGCITPSGCDFVTNEQTVLTGSQMLRLQGMPNDKLLFARESQKDLQDLAGNAMSTTVIGASLISALLCGTKFFAKSKPTMLKARYMPVEFKSTLVPPKVAITHISTSMNDSEVDIAVLSQEAFMSSRLCGCEQFANTSDTFVRICEACGHTACARHAGNPTHTYTYTLARNNRTHTPHDFLKKWKSVFPSRLRFAAFPDPWELISKAATDDKHVVSFLERVREADIASQYLYIGEIERQEGRWSFTYSSAEVTLKARVSKTIEWWLYVKSPSSLPGDVALRKVFEQPIARGRVFGSLLAPEWEFFIPFSTTHTLQIQASTESTSSWRNRHGLPDYKHERTPTKLKISSEASEVEPMLGDYQLQPGCGTACDSLYKKAGNCSSAFLFLDPGLVSDPTEDSFVFSDDLDRRIYGESRITFGSLASSWRPWDIPSDKSWNVDVTIPGNWVPFSPILTSTPLSVEAFVPSTASLVMDFRDCAEALTVLDIQITEDFDAKRITELSWIPEDIKRLPDFGTWHTSASTDLTDCSCAPISPQLVWSVVTDDDGKSVATARENAKAAATFERALKLRCPIFTIQPSDRSRLQIGLNIASLVHRAQGRLPHSRTWSTAWRLCVDHGDVAPVRLPKYTLQCNSATAPFDGKLSLRNNLYHSQLQSLAWMKAQEQGRPLIITEVEEVTHKELGWRAEARVQTTVTVRGGVLADRPSFGKTVTTIALLQSEFQQYSPEDLLNQDTTTSSEAFSLRALSATLIVCPPHIARQWQSEMQDFLGSKLFKQYNILLIEDFADLQQHTIDDFKEARVIILSWSVLSDEEYISQLAQFAAMPEPATAVGCGFDAWMGKVTEEVPERLDVLSQSKNLADFEASTAKLLDDRLSLPEFKETVPIKLQHGAQYESYNATQGATAKPAVARTKKPKAKPTRSAASRVTHIVPFLHLFRFNRIVVDEYHYLLNDKTGQNYPAYVGVKAISALNRWVLSGTPALSNFSDVNEIASFLGVKLGRNVFGDGATFTPFEKKLMDQQTDVQKFLMRTEIMSRQWHEARYERAQEFLDLFVRKNKPSLEHIACREHLQPIQLDLAHNAVYLELSQYLIAQGMQLRRPSGKSKANTDRVNRIDAILNDSASAEDALLKGALGLHGKGIESLIQTRSNEQEKTKSDILSILVGFESLTAMDDEVKQLYQCFKGDVQDLYALGDGDSSHAMRLLLDDAVPNAESRPQKMSTVSGKKGPERVKALKNEISKLRELARDLVLKTRSLRFIKAIQTVAPAISPTEGVKILRCNSADCRGISSVHQLRLIAECGHLACENCLAARDHHENCVQPTCGACVTVTALIEVTDLGTPEEEAADHNFGNKLVAMAQGVLDTPKDDQCIIFVPNLETISTVEAVLKHFSISYIALGKNKVAAARSIESFKTNKDPKTRNKVLLLNLGSESAAGTYVPIHPLPITCYHTNVSPAISPTRITSSSRPRSSRSPSTNSTPQWHKRSRAACATDRRRRCTFITLPRCTPST
jgi:site-specific DNA-cytosine methylase